MGLFDHFDLGQLVADVMVQFTIEVSHGCATEDEGDKQKEFHLRRAGLRGFAVLAARLKLAAVGAPFCPGRLIFSPEPAAILALFL